MKNYYFPQYYQGLNLRKKLLKRGIKVIIELKRQPKIQFKGLSKRIKRVEFIKI